MTHIDKFQAKMAYSKVKTLKSGIEVRGMADVEQSIAQARAVIASMKLNLEVINTADMSCYGAFEVREVVR